MYIEDSLSVKDITLNHFMLDDGVLLNRKKCQRILIAPNQDFILYLNDVKHEVHNQLCFIDGRNKCEIKAYKEYSHILYLEFIIDDQLQSLSKHSFIDINEDIRIFCSYVKTLHIKKSYTPQILNFIMTYFLMLNEAIYLNEKKSYQQCPKIIFEIKAYLKDNIESKIQIQDIANKFFMSRSELFYLFKKYAHTTIIDYLNTIRMKKAEELLADSRYTITEISQLVGYDSLQYFSRVFKKRNGCSPSEFRKQLIKRFQTFYIGKGGEIYENIKKYPTI